MMVSFLQLEQLKSTSKTLQEESKELIANLNVSHKPT